MRSARWATEYGGQDQPIASCSQRWLMLTNASRRRSLASFGHDRLYAPEGMTRYMSVRRWRLISGDWCSEELPPLASRAVLDGHQLRDTVWPVVTPVVTEIFRRGLAVDAPPYPASRLARRHSHCRSESAALVQAHTNAMDARPGYRSAVSPRPAWSPAVPTRSMY